MRTIYLIAAIVGAVGPYVFFAQFFAGPDAGLGAFTAQLFATPPAAGFTTDLLITSVVFWIWSFQEARRLRMSRWWAYVVVNLTIGLSCALPLFFYVRELQVQEGRAST